MTLNVVIPAQAGIHIGEPCNLNSAAEFMDSRLRGNDARERS